MNFDFWTSMPLTFRSVRGVSVVWELLLSVSGKLSSLVKIIKYIYNKFAGSGLNWEEMVKDWVLKLVYCLRRDEGRGLVKISVTSRAGVGHPHPPVTKLSKTQGNIFYLGIYFVDFKVKIRQKSFCYIIIILVHYYISPLPHVEMPTYQ